MGRPKRIRRRLTLHVSERQPDNPNETWTPGQRFAHGWGKFLRGSSGPDELAECHGDPIQIAGYLAAKAAWDAHHYAVNWIDPSDGGPTHGR